MNSAQREAVEHVEGPMMVIAGAGSGKTRVLIYRIAHLIDQGVDPFKILALTFTNKAAREMKERIANLIGGTEAGNIWMGTFHSIFARILRIEADKIGYQGNFSIYDTQDSRNLIKTIIKEMNLDDKLYKPSVVHNRISSAKNSLISARDYNKNDEITGEDRMLNRPKLGEIYAKYDQRLFQAGAMDFDDLLFKTNILLRDVPEVLHKYQSKFQFLLVDEYQDTNYSQYLICKKLAARHENLCVVGDDAQSIYAFRGANIQNILNFKKDYPDYSLYKLEQNYRSTKTIVEAANSIIAHNKEQIKKTVWTDNGQGDVIKVIRSASDNEEGRTIANHIFELKMNDQAKDKEFAILYRTNAQSRSFEEALRKLNIPYRIYGGLSFYQRKEIKDLLGYMRLTANLNDEESLKRIINYPKRGIGQTTMDKIIVAAGENGVSPWKVLTQPTQYHVNIAGGTAKKIGEFVTMIKRFRTGMEEKSAYEIGYEIAKVSGILNDLYNDKTPEGISRYENIQELLNGLKEFAERNSDANKLPDFLVDVALLTDAESPDKDDKEHVSLMTIHAAKGLEFPYIFVVGMEENLFPSQLSLNSRADLEEERRLFYVAITRAKKKATLSYATSRYRWGNLIHCEPSRFLDEIAEEFVDFPTTQSFGGWDGPKDDFADVFEAPKGKQAKIATRKKKPEAPGPSPSIVGRNLKKVNKASGGGGTDLTGIAVGVEVEHDRFGKGKVLTLEGNAPNVKATVFFPAAGQKQLLLKFAKLKVL